jgi:hypothetical protein
MTPLRSGADFYQTRTYPPIPFFFSICSLVSKFESLIAVRHQHDATPFGRSDLYFVCRMSAIDDEQPIAYDHAGEIADCRWMPVCLLSFFVVLFVVFCHDLYFVCRFSAIDDEQPIAYDHAGEIADCRWMPGMFSSCVFLFVCCYVWCFLSIAHVHFVAVV